MDLYTLTGIIPIFVAIMVVAMVGLIVIPEITEQITIKRLDKTCFKLEKIMYCDSIGMELGSIVVTPAGLFGGTPYNKEACVSENSEKIIELKDLNWKKCE